MTAQQQWKSTYRAMKKQQNIGKMGNLELIAWIHELHHFRREAALERIIARQKREIDALHENEISIPERSDMRES